MQVQELVKRRFFSAEEKQQLKALVHKYKDILECKKTDCISVSIKKTTWAKLAKEYNSILQNSYRSVDQLRKCWDNMKTRQKKELFMVMNEKILSGDGNFKPKVSTDNNHINSFLNTVHIELKQEAADTYLPDDGADTEGEIPNSSFGSFLEDHCSEASMKSRISNNLEATSYQYYTPREPPLENGIAPDRFDRNKMLQIQEAEIHAVRLEEYRLRIEERKEELAAAKLRVEQEQVKLDILRQQLKKEML